jgi:large exoprotein involved in heme utilization and adhesion
LRLSDGAVLNAQTETAFKGGSITVNVNILELARGGQLVTTALSSGNAGNITVNATDSVTISGSDPNFNNRLKVDKDASGLFARTQGTGTGGTLQITTGLLQVLDGAKVVVSSTGSGDAGNLEASANSIRLDRAILSAETTAGQGNINLRSGDLVLRRGSKITTDATGRATGGNITINTDNLVAIPKEDSNIRANAAESFGGRIIINAKGIFGIQFHERDTPLSDITASSELGPEFSGTVQINTPDADPSRGLTNLPTDLVDASNQIAQNCATDGAVAREQSSFVVIGRGGLPPNPKEPLSSDDVRVDLVTLNPKSEYRSVPSITNNPISPTPAPLVEATGWVINAKGEVVLTAYAPNVTPHSSWQKPTECHASESALRY